MKLNWLYRCALYFLISMVVGPFYDGWSSTAKYLISEGVYSRECKDSIEKSKLYHLKPICDEQAYQVGRLLSFYRISEFLSSIVIGVFMDNIGPKFTVLIALLLRMLSWVLIPLCPNIPAVVILSCILAGVTSNGIAFPVFTIAQYSKKYYNTCMIAISVSLSFGTFYTFVLNYFKYWLSEYQPLKIILVKLALTHLPLLVLCLFLFPNSLEKDVKLNLINEAPGKKDEDITNGVPNAQKSAQPDRRWNFLELLSIIRRIDILTLSLASMVNVISLTYSQESFPISYGNDKVALIVNEILIPLSFVFSVASVFLLNNFGPVPIIIFLNVMGAVLHLTMAFTNTILSYFTSFLMSLGYSLFMTQYYLYLDIQVPLAYQGSVKGYLVTVIGFLLFLNIWFNHISKVHKSTSIIHYCIMAVRILVTFPLFKFLKTCQIRRSSFDLSIFELFTDVRCSNMEEIPSLSWRDKAMLSLSLKLVPSQHIPQIFIKRCVNGKVKTKSLWYEAHNTKESSFFKLNRDLKNEKWDF